jgi:TolB-like protein
MSRRAKRLEVDAQLISTESGVVIWGDSFQPQRSGLGEMQVELVSRIGGAVWLALAPR